LQIRKNNIKADIMETGLDDMDWIDLVQDRYKWKYCEHGGFAPWRYLVILLGCLYRVPKIHKLAPECTATR